MAAITTVLVVVCAILGLAVGSFVMVLADRIPAGRSFIAPPSSCAQCGHRIRGRDNVPVLSWFALRGRCRDCRARISVRYPLIELGCATLFAAVAVRFAPGLVAPAVGAVGFVGPAGDRIATVLILAAYLYLAAASIALALIDSVHHRLPNVIVLPAYGVGVVLLGAASFFQHQVDHFFIGLACAGGLFAFYLLLAVVSRRGMGLGDVKLAGVLGLFLGFLGLDAVLVATMAAFVFGGVYGCILLATRRARRSSAVAFGPWMLAGTWLAVFWAPALTAAYLQLFGLELS